MLEDELLSRFCPAEGDPQTWVDKMIAEANRRGGLDNITAIVVRIDAVDQPRGKRRRSPGRLVRRTKAAGRRWRSGNRGPWL
jgi:serine/threonine protein phosphatase PrpC